MTAGRVVARVVAIVVAVALCATPALAAPKDRGGHRGTARADHSLREPVTDEVFYFVMADRFENGDTSVDTGGLTGDRMTTGFDPTSRGFYNGGDLAGLLDRIDYIQDMGVTSIWLTPSFKNKAVQPEDGPSAGYHGLLDHRLHPDRPPPGHQRRAPGPGRRRPRARHEGLLRHHHQPHRRRHRLRGGRAPALRLEGRRALPDRRRHAVDDRDHAGSDTFPPLDPATSFPFTPALEAGEENLKVPDWLNDHTLYHNRGDTTFVGGNSLYGDFFGLDDLFTEHPRVVQGMIDIYQTWVADAGIDGFRIDTMKHVDTGFWQAFGPAVLEFARDRGCDEFFMFGEVFDQTKWFTSYFTTTADMQSVLDFPFQEAARGFASRSAPTRDLETFLTNDDWYTDADSNAYQLPTFLGNHDMGRIGHFVVADNPGAGDAEWVARDRLAHELMFFSRGNPVIYYGDEQGFTGAGGDQLARQTMFASQRPHRGSRCRRRRRRIARAVACT